MRVSQDESRSGVSRVAIRRIDHLGPRSNSLNPDDSSVDWIFWKCGNAGRWRPGPVLARKCSEANFQEFKECGITLTHSSEKGSKDEKGSGRRWAAGDWRWAGQSRGSFQTRHPPLLMSLLLSPSHGGISMGEWRPLASRHRTTWPWHRQPSGKIKREKREKIQWMRFK